MYFIRFVFVLCVIICGNLVSSQFDEHADKEEGEEISREENELPESHTFVALIDIVFTNGSKRTCTGTIIHDNVVITAAHCFVDENDEYTLAELTASFVVIGTKKMFDTGYEQYLPIERVIIHPKFRGWTADLALVYTFAGMTSDKPGQIMPLAVVKKSTPVDSNLTVVSWGHCNEEIPVKNIDDSCGDSCDDVDESSKVTAPVVFYRPRNSEDHPIPKYYKNKLRKQVKPNEDATTRKQDPMEEYLSLRQQMVGHYTVKAVKTDKKKVARVGVLKKLTTKRISMYLSSDEEKTDTQTENLDQFRFKSIGNTSVYPSDAEDMATDSWTSHEVFKGHTTKQRANKNNYANKETKRYNIKKFKNWRRTMGKQQNRLTVEVFGFVNVQTCKKLIERAMPNLYEIKDGNDIVCYSSEDHYITSEDSGAPALRKGHLVAVTVGGVECDGDHVAVGMKMTCFCSWIAKNLPDGGANLKCCKNCCDVQHTDQQEKHEEKKAGRYRNKYLLK